MTSEDVDAQFAGSVRAAREGRGWSQSELAARMSARGTLMQATTIYKIETGKRRVTIAEAASIAASLGASLSEMIGRSDGDEFVIREVILEHGMEALFAHEKALEVLRVLLDRQTRIEAVLTAYREQFGESPGFDATIADDWAPLAGWTGPEDYLKSWRELNANVENRYALDRLGWADDRTKLDG